MSQNFKISKVAVIGSGIMGEGIANTIFRQNIEVRVFDMSEEARKRAFESIKSKARKSMDLSKIILADTLEDAVKDVDLVIEAIIEKMDVKIKFFSDINKFASPKTIFATNTSSLNIDDLAKGSGRPTKFVGLHFFNPAVIMRLVEIIKPQSLDSNVLSAVDTFVADIKKTGIKCKNSPGFVVNRVLLPLLNEAFFLVEDKVKKGQDLISAANEIDSAIVKENILVMGPFDLADLTGNDTAYAVANVIYNGLNQDERYTPAPLLKDLASKKLIGRKGGKGIYHYQNNQNDPDLNPRLDDKGNKVLINDNPNFDVFEILLPMVNESLRVLEEGIVDSYKDIETCMELGTRWPLGPFALAKKYGFNKIKKLLEEKYSKTKLKRYEPSKLFNKLPDELDKFLTT